eukprot:m.147744 g.147744  ORF g.147744 m.147744 type:complete len:1343 (+) comp14990_c0_seq12:181-4209(+)
MNEDILASPVLMESSNDQGQDEVSKLTTAFEQNGTQEAAEALVTVLRERFKELNRDVKKCAHEFGRGARVLEASGSMAASSKAIAALCDGLLIALDDTPSGSFPLICEDLITIVTKNYVSGKSLDLFPKLLSAISGHAHVSLEDHPGLTGMSYKQNVIERLCNHKWPAVSVSNFAGIMLDVPLDGDCFGILLNALLDMLKTQPLSEVPQLVYQLLLLSNKGQRALIIGSMLDYLGSLEPEDAGDDELVTDHCSQLTTTRASQQVVRPNLTQSSLRPVQGTCILHITFAAKQDQHLGREIIKYMKATNRLTTFSVALCLSLARIHRFETAVFDLLKGLAMSSFKEEKMAESSVWIRDHTDNLIDLRSIFRQVAICSTYGWDQVVQGLVQLGVMFIDTCKADTPPVILPSAQHRTCKLGAHLLHTTFRLQSDAREEILEQILSRVIARSSNSTDVFIDLLRLIIADSPAVVSSSSQVQRLRDSLDYISQLEPHTSSDLLYAMRPVIMMSTTLRDSLLIVLRKALFSRSEQARMVAVTGYIMILHDIAQLQQTSQGATSTQDLEGLANEILTCLRRCLSQQGVVREQLYEGLVRVANDSKNQTLCVSILSLIATQFSKIINTGDENTPLNMDACVKAKGESPTIMEPFGALVRAITRIIRTCPEDNSLVKELKKDMLKCATALAKAEPEDFGLDKSAEYGPGISANFLRASVLAHTQEAFVSFLFVAQESDVEMGNRIAGIMKQYDQILKVLKSKADPKAKDGVNKLMQEQIDFDVLAEMFEALYVGNDETLPIGIKMLRNTANFIRFVLQATPPTLSKLVTSNSVPKDKFYHSKPSQLSKRSLGDTSIPEEGRDSQQPTQTTKPDSASKNTTVKSIASTILASCERIAIASLSGWLAAQNEAVSSSESGTQKKKKGGDKTKTTQHMCLEALHLCVTLVCKQFPSELQRFLESIGEHVPHSEIEDVISDASTNDEIAAAWIMRTMVKALDGEHYKECTLMLNVVQDILQCKHYGQAREKVTDVIWQNISEICVKFRPLDDIPLGRQFVALLLQDDRSGLTRIEELGQDMLHNMGTFEEEEDMDVSSKHGIVSVKLCESGTVSALTISALDRHVSEIEWVLPRLKLQRSPTEEEAEVVMSMAEAIAHRLKLIVVASMTITRVGHERKATHDMFRCLTRLYQCLFQLVKFRILAKTKLKIDVDRHFETLVNKVNDVTSIIYTVLVKEEEAPEQKSTAKRKRDQAAAVRESKIIPGMIQAIEKYEQQLIVLTEKSDVRFVKSIKRSVVRDFRIKMQDVQRAIDRRNGDDEDDDEKVKKSKRKQASQMSGKPKKRASNSDNENEEGEEE